MTIPNAPFKGGFPRTTVPMQRPVARPNRTLQVRFGAGSDTLGDANTSPARNKGFISGLIQRIIDFFEWLGDCILSWKESLIGPRYGTPDWTANKADKLRTAILTNNIKTAKKLLQAAENHPDRQIAILTSHSSFTCSPIHLAVQGGQVPMVRALLHMLPRAKRHEILDYRDRQFGQNFDLNKKTILGKAIEKKNQPLIHTLLDSVPETAHMELLRNAGIRGLLQEAIRSDNAENVRTLFGLVPKTERASVLSQPEFGEDTLFCQAVQKEHGAAEFVQTLMALVPEADRSELVNRSTTGLTVLRDEMPLHMAARKGDIPLIQELLKHGADMAKTNFEGETPLWMANSPETVQQMLELIPSSERAAHLKTIQEDRSLLSHIYGMRPDSVEHIRSLLDLLPDAAQSNIVNESVNASQNTLLHLAVIRNNIPLVHELLARGADASKQDSLMATPLRYAYSPEITQLLLEKIPEDQRLGIVIRPYGIGRTILSDVISLHDYVRAQMIVDMLPKEQRAAALKSGSNITGNVIHYAVASSNPQFVRTLLNLIPEQDRLGVICHPDMIGGTALAEAVNRRQGCLDMLQAILNTLPEAERTEAVNGAIDNEGNRLIHRAVQNNNVPLMDALLNTYGANINQPNGEGNTPLHLVLQNRNTNRDQVWELIVRGAQVNIANNAGETPIWLANSPEVMRLLLNGVPETIRTAVVRQPNAQGDTLLTRASNLGQNRDVAMTRAILDSIPEADRANAVNQTVDEPGNSIFHLAAREGNLPLTAVLADYGAAINRANLQGETPLHLATLGRNTNLVQTLLSRGAHVNASTHAGNTPLHIATHQNNREIVKVLLARGANANQQNADGHTPLARGLRLARDMRTLRCLFEAGANPALLGNELQRRDAENYRRGVASIYQEKLYGTNAEAVQGRLGLQRLVKAGEPWRSTINGFTSQMLRWNDPTWVKQATKALQRLAKYDIPKEEWQEATNQCNAFLKNKLKALNDLKQRQEWAERAPADIPPQVKRHLVSDKEIRMQRLSLLARCRPVIRTGVPYDLSLRDQLLEHARQVKYIEFMRDVVPQDFDYTTVSQLLPSVVANNVPIQNQSAE